MNSHDCDVSPGVHQERCGCKLECRDGIHFNTLCRFHWNETHIKMELERARSWERRGGGRRLNPEDRYDRRCLDFYDQIAYWAAKAATEAGARV